MNGNLSKNQQFIIDKIKEGFELGQSITFDNFRCWMQKGGCGRGGESIDVRASTVWSLVHRGMLTYKDEFPLRRFKLK